LNEQLAKNSSYTEDSLLISLIKKSGSRMLAVPQELLYEAWKKVDEQNFDFALLLSQSFYRCQDKGDK